MARPAKNRKGEQAKRGTRRPLPSVLRRVYVLADHAARMLGVSRDTVLLMAKSGRLERRQKLYTGRVLITRESIQRLLEEE